MSHRIELVSGVLAGVAGFAGLLLTLLLASGVMSGKNSMSLGSAVFFFFGLLLVALVTGSAYVHAEFGWGLGLLWLSLLVLLVYTWFLLTLVPALALGCIAGISGMTRRGTRYA